MAIETLERVLNKHPFFADIDDKYGQLIAGCAKNVRFNAGEFIFKEGGAADSFYILRQGQVSLEIHSPGHAPLTLETLKEGDMLGAAWLVPPYRWLFDARARTLVRAIALDGECLRDKCEKHNDLGYALMKRFSQVLVERLNNTRIQLLDVYGLKDA